MKKILVVFIILSGLLFFNLPVYGQSKTLETTLEDVRDEVQNLVTAKDEGSLNELFLRIETFKKVIDFSISEAKNLKIKLLALDKINEETEAWRGAVINKLNQALSYYEKQKTLVEDAAKIDIETIKKIAADFKKWREEVYLPTAEEANVFLLISQEEKAIEIAERRWQRINKDITNLEKTKVKGADTLRKLLNNAGKLIEEGKLLNQKAESIFWENYILITATTSTSTATSSVSTATSTATSTNISTPTSTIPKTAEKTAATSSPIVTVTSTETNTTSTISFTPTASIKDLVEESLNKIKDAYQVFIEMSNLVRKLLN